MKNKRLLVNLDDYIEEIGGSREHALSGSYEDEDGKLKTVTVLSDKMFKDYFEYKFYNYNMWIRDTEDIEASIIKKFNSLWIAFLAEEQENLNKLVASYYWKYVPVYNYDRFEETHDVRSGSETNNTDHVFAQFSDNDKTTGSYKDVETPEGTTTTTTKPTGIYTENNHPEGSYKDTTTTGAKDEQNKVATMDSSSYERGTQFVTTQTIDTVERTFDDYNNYTDHSFDDYQEEVKTAFQGYKNTTERTFTNYDIEHKHGSHTDQDNTPSEYEDVTDEHTGHMYGNIGVTTSVQMATEEFNFRIHELGFEFLKRFFDRNAFMI